MRGLISGFFLAVLLSPGARAECELSPHQIQEFISSHRQAVIYLWSGGMPLSVQGLQEIQNLAREKSIPLLVLSDPDAPLPPAGMGCRLVPGAWLTSGARDHYPTLLVVRDGQLDATFLQGYEPIESAYRFIQVRWTRDARENGE